MPQNSGAALLSLGKLHDDDCIVIGDRPKCVARKDRPKLKVIRFLTTGACAEDIENPILQPATSSFSTLSCQTMSTLFKIFSSIDRLNLLCTSLCCSIYVTLRRDIEAGLLLSFP